MSVPVPIAASLYAAVTALGTPALALSSRRARLGGPGAVPERFGRGGPGDGAPRLWLHGASVGETTVARTLHEAVRTAGGALPTVATAHTVTGRDTLRCWAEDRAEVRLAPWDTPVAVARFVRGWNPAAYLFVDSELWPSRLLRLSGAGAVILGANARMSERSAARWQRLAPRLAAALLSRVDLLCAQDDLSAGRFVRLGLPPDRLGPSEALKSAFAPSTPLHDEERLRAFLPRERTVLAASTHPGEEEMALGAFLAARERVAGLRLVIAPRHPERGREIAGLVRRRGLLPVLRSAGPADLSDPDVVYVADTLGELRRFYAMSALAFVGGSTDTLGGHTPFEPVGEGCVVAHGPDTANAADAYAALGRAGASVPVPDAAGLADAFALLARPDAIARMASRASAALRPPDPVVPGLVAERVVRAIAARRGGRGAT